MSDHPDDRTDDPVEPIGQPSDAIDLERIARDFDGVDAALRRLDDGSDWSDEVTGAEIPDRVLAADPVARRTDEG